MDTPTTKPVETPTAPKVDTPTTKPVETPKDDKPEVPKEKAAPVLKLTNVTDDAMARTANLNYSLENTDDAKIKSIVAEIKDGDKVVKTVDLSKEKLTDAARFGHL